MRWKAGAAAVVCCLLAGGCSGAETDISAIQECYAQQNVSAEVEITTHTGVLADYTIVFEQSGESARTTLTEPESLAGISASTQDRGAQITYEDIAVETLLPPLGGFVPVDAMAGIVNDLAGGIPVETCEEKTESGRSTVLSFESSFEDCEGLKRIWIAQDTLAVERAEFYLDGQMIMTLSVKNMSFLPGTPAENADDS